MFLSYIILKWFIKDIQNWIKFINDFLRNNAIYGWFHIFHQNFKIVIEILIVLSTGC